MKMIIIPFFRPCLLLFFVSCLMPTSVFCQGFERVIHTSGTEQVGCTEVTVTSSGGVSTVGSNNCNTDPYRVGVLAPGSYTFSFSSPIGGARIDAAALDYFSATNLDELAVDVNGSFYPITNPGATSCSPVWVEIWPPGTIRAPFGQLGGATEAIMIDETMTSLTVANNYGSTFLFSLYIIACPVCMTGAGTIVASPLDLCPSDLATVPPAVQTFLDSDDILQYILFSDLNDTLGSTIITSNMPEFPFDPATMQPGVTYYIAAIAGNDLGGNVDLNDPCLDISNAIEVVWHPEPTVAFNSPITDVCADNCYDVEINFTGTPPFQLAGEVTAGSNIISTFDDTYQGLNETLTICLPANTPVGTITIQATSLTDANCTCN